VVSVWSKSNSASCMGMGRGGTSAYRHARLRTCVGVEQGQRATVEAGRQDHPFADAETHLARGEVGDEHDAAAHQLLRLGIAGADAGKDLALAQFASIEQE